MHDIKKIRNNPQDFDAAMKKRDLEPISAKILQLDNDNRENIAKLQDLQEKSNYYAKQIGVLKSKGEDATDAINKSKQFKTELADLKKQLEDNKNNNPLHELLSSLPNIPDEDVPDGLDESFNKVIRTWGEIPKLDFKAKEHFDLGEDLKLMDFEQTAKISGSRFVTLKGDLAKLERALGNFMLDVQTEEFDYEELSPPILVRDDAMFGSGQLPKFAEDSFATTNNYRLIPTSEVSLVNQVRELILDEADLPIRYTACTPCFRSEAGSAGKDTRGMIRQHQFWKVELVSITKEDESEAELERMTNCAETILQKLNLPYQVILKCVGDTGFHANKTYDIEVWLPGQDKYREISSCSNCRDFQGRRMNSRYRANKDKNPKFVHTLNGTGVAIGRCLIAILENYQNADGSIDIPQILQPYMGGKKKIG